jgi:thiamine-phosphate pyrophosphorylase
VTDRHSRLADAHVYLVCDAEPDAFLDAALRGGADVVQLRIKHGRDAEIVGNGRRFQRACREHGALFILNDHPDLVAEAGADGVHVGQEDMAVSQARELLGPELLIGLSTHSPEQIDEALAAGVDYIAVGPVHATPTKPGRPAVGLELVRYAAAHAGELPFFAIGGIAPENVDAARAAGATRVAVVRALTEASDPESAARVLRSAVTCSEAQVGPA